MKYQEGEVAKLQSCTTVGPFFWFGTFQNHWQCCCFPWVEAWPRGDWGSWGRGSHPSVVIAFPILAPGRGWVMLPGSPMLQWQRERPGLTVTLGILWAFAFFCALDFWWGSTCV